MTCDQLQVLAALDAEMDAWMEEQEVEAQRIASIGYL